MRSLGGHGAADLDRNMDAKGQDLEPQTPHSNMKMNSSVKLMEKGQIGVLPVRDAAEVSSVLTPDNWSVKAIHQKTGSGSMCYLRHVPRRFKSNFLEGTEAGPRKKAACAASF